MKFLYYLLIPVLIFSSCKRQQKLGIQRIEGKQITIDDKLADEKDIDQFISPYRDSLHIQMNEVLAYNPKELTKINELSETNIGNFMADLCYKIGNQKFKNISNHNLDFVLFNHGGIRASIPKGDVKVRNAFEVMPFENEMVVVKLSYDNMQDLLQYLARNEKAHPVSYTLRLEIKDEQVVTAKINGKPLENRPYYVLTSDYLQNGGDHMIFFQDPLELYPLDYKIRDAILDELSAIDTIQAGFDGRVVRK